MGCVCDNCLVYVSFNFGDDVLCFGDIGEVVIMFGYLYYLVVDGGLVNLCCICGGDVWYVC